jgi:hypothetical protein
MNFTFRNTRYFRAGKKQTEYRWKVISKRKIADLVVRIHPLLIAISASNTPRSSALLQTPADD